MICTKCGEEKPKYREDSLHCKECIFAAQKEWRDKNPERVKIHRERSRAKGRYTEAQKRASLKWREKNRDKYNAYMREYVKNKKTSE